MECDGATYHSSKSARDRDRLREEVLIRRGWNIHRIWSTDWFKCRPDEIERLKKRLQQLVESGKHKVVQVEEPLPSYQIVPDLEARKLSDEELRDRITLFCVENIPRSLEWQKKDGFLNEEILSVLVEKRITDNFGKHLKKAMDTLGIECVHKMDTDFKSRNEQYAAQVQFLEKHFGIQ